jgi:signal transduction histidine kinase
MEEQMHLNGQTPLRSSLIAENERVFILTEIFHDALLLNQSLAIQAIGKSASAELGFSMADLKDKLIDTLIPDFATELIPLLSNGFFKEKELCVNSKDGKVQWANLSGFYTGLLTDINGFIIIRLNVLRDTIAIKNQLAAKTNEMDHFIYVASHSLRGPIATIKGLTDIAKTEKDPVQLDFILDKIREFGDRLDSKLYKLISFASADRDRGIPTGNLDAAHLETQLIEESKKILENPPAIVCRVNLPTYKINENLIESLMINLVTFLLSAPIFTDSSIHLQVAEQGNFLKISINTFGLSFDEKFQHILLGNHGYGHLLEQPNLTEAYSAQKVIQKLNGRVGFERATDFEGIVKITIPYSFVSLYKK